MTPTTHPHDLEPTSPDEAVDRYIREKRAEGITDSTAKKIQWSLNPFLEWTKENGITNLNNLSPKRLHDFKLWLQAGDEEYAPATLEAYLTDVRALIESAEAYGGVPHGLADTMQIPRAQSDRKHEVISEDRAEAILERLNRFEFASRRHIEFAVIWDCGLRCGALRSLDLEDFITDDSEYGPHLRLVSRGDQGTRLKNGSKSERRLFLQTKTVETIEAWITHKRPKVPDNYDRKPLLTTEHGRVCKDAIKKDMQRVTAPCFLNEPCEDCNSNHPNRKCPDALSPHPLRRGAITRDLNTGTIPEHVSERYDVSVEIIREHYDARTDKEKMKVRREAYMKALQDSMEND